MHWTFYINDLLKCCFTALVVSVHCHASGVHVAAEAANTCVSLKVCVCERECMCVCTHTCMSKCVLVCVRTHVPVCLYACADHRVISGVSLVSLLYFVSHGLPEHGAHCLATLPGQ